MANRSNEQLQENASLHSTLTVENVTKLELEYESIDGVLLERRKVEEYIRKAQELEEPQRSTGSLLSATNEQDAKPLLKSMTSTVEDPSRDGNTKEMQTSTDSVTKKISKVSSSKSMKRQVTNVRKFQCKNVQTQTEWNLHDISPAISKSGTAEQEGLHTTVLTVSSLKQTAQRTPEPSDIDTMSTSKVTEQCSLNSENTIESKSSDSDGENPGQSEHPLNVEEPLKQAEAEITFCEFCLMPEKPFPSVEQLALEPAGMLFCCVKKQELFQYMIMEIITLYTPEEAEQQNEAEPSPPQMSNEMEALHRLREELKKTNTKEYITSLANHLNTHGSLFVMEKITFTLANERISNNLQSADPYSDPIHNIDDYFIPIPILHNKPIMRPTETINECYTSGQNFLILFPDGTGQVLYPSGNIGILIACSKPSQSTFIILEDAEKNPQIQAVFMSNGHAACYHLNGMLWTVLDPRGGSYFDEKGTWRKQWTWWDFSQHVHAPPFQPITLKLSPNIEVKILTQDQVYLSFTKEKQNVTFNVGSKLTLKDPESIFQLKSRIGELECYLCSKKLQIYGLLRNMRNLLRISNSSEYRIETIQEYIGQLQRSLNYITGLARKQVDSYKEQKTELVQENVTTMKKHHQYHPEKTLSAKTDSLNVQDNKKGTTNGGNKQKIKL